MLQTQTAQYMTTPTAVLYGCETFSLACSGWRGQM